MDGVSPDRRHMVCFASVSSLVSQPLIKPEATNLQTACYCYEVAITVVKLGLVLYFLVSQRSQHKPTAFGASWQDMPAAAGWSCKLQLACPGSSCQYHNPPNLFLKTVTILLQHSISHCLTCRSSSCPPLHGFAPLLLFVCQSSLVVWAQASSAIATATTKSIVPQTTGACAGGHEPCSVVN
jgi:hypothetical protein